MPKNIAATTKQTGVPLSSRRVPNVPPVRTSQLLRELLTKNPTVKTFTVERIVNSIGHHRVGTSLMVFSIPGMVPVPGTADLVGIPTGAIAWQIISGKKEIELPKFVLERSVPRGALAVAIHAILPVLQRAEKAAKPRWHWASHPEVQRILGVLIFVLALAIAIPLLGFNVAHAAAIFTISLGLVEQDGVAILIGVVAGLASLVLVLAAGVSGKALRSKAFVWARDFTLKLGLNLVVTFAKKFGYKWVKRILSCDLNSSSYRAKNVT